MIHARATQVNDLSKLGNFQNSRVNFPSPSQTGRRACHNKSLMDALGGAGQTSWISLQRRGLPQTPSRKFNSERQNHLPASIQRPLLRARGKVSCGNSKRMKMKVSVERQRARTSVSNQFAESTGIINRQEPLLPRRKSPGLPTFPNQCLPYLTTTRSFKQAP
jgi:hypothetical protein